MSRHAIHSTQRGFTGKAQIAHDAALEDIAADPYKSADITLTYQIAEKLERHYPAHPWMVQVTHAGGVAMIKLPLVMKRTEWYVLHISALKVDPGLKLVMRAGGELLERYNIPRAGFNLTPFLEARDKAQPKKKIGLILPGFMSSARAGGATSALGDTPADGARA